MSNAEWLRFIPFAIVALNLACWSLIEQFSDRPWSIAKVTIIVTGYAIAIYTGSLALNYSWLEITWPPKYYDVVRVGMAVSIIGTPFLIRNTWWAYQGWYCRQKEKNK